MNWRKILLLWVIIAISLIFTTTGCGTRAFFTNQINPIEKEKVNLVIINRGGSQQEKFTDKGMITEIIDNLNKVKVKKSSRDEDIKLLDSGNALQKNSTIIIHLLTDNNSELQSMAILLSEKELYLPDIRSMQGNTYTASYINDSDETTLKSINAIYSLAVRNTK